jgi:peptide/nickel transport system permease protein
MSAVIDAAQPEVQAAGRRRPAYGGRIGWLRGFIARKPLGAIGGALVLLLIVIAIAAPVTAPYPYDVGNAAERLQGPTIAHPFGTDANGRDMLSRIIWGAQVSVTVGFGAVLISTVLAVTIGMISGYYGGWVDLDVQRLVDVWISFPALVLLISMVAVAGPGLWSITAILGILLAPGTSRVVRSAVRAIRHQPYIESASCIGAGDTWVLLRYILPNVFAPIIVLATVQLGTAILAESTLSFLGYGVPPPYPAWGSMLSGTGRAFMLQSPWLSIWPGLAISLAVFGFNMLGDALRDELDPRLRGSR